MKLITKSLLVIITLIGFIFTNFFVNANYEKPIAPSELNLNTITLANKILDNIYSKKDNLTKYPTEQSYITYIDKIYLGLNNLKSTFNSSDLRYIIINYINLGIYNIKVSLESNSSILDNISSIVNDLNVEGCEKTITYGNLIICDTGKVYTDKDIKEIGIKSSKTFDQSLDEICPKTKGKFSVPSGYQWEYIINSGINIKLDNPYYFTRDLYGTTVDNVRTTTIIGDIVSNTLPAEQRKHVLCINSNFAPLIKSTIDKHNGTKNCEIPSKKDLFSKYNLKYEYNETIRPFLFDGEEYIIKIKNSQLKKGNLDFNLSLKCNNNKIEVKEIIEKVNSCNFGYNKIDNDCIIDKTICNLENIYNSHPTSSKTCEWKILGEESLGYYKFYSINRNSDFYMKGLSFNDLINELKFIDSNNYFIDSKFKNSLMTERNEVYNKYHDMYKNKVDIQVKCTESKEYEMKCIVEGLFWE